MSENITLNENPLIVAAARAISGAAPKAIKSLAAKDSSSQLAADITGKIAQNKILNMMVGDEEEEEQDELDKPKLPESIIRRKQEISDMTEEKRKQFFSGMSEETLVKMASSHGYVDSNKYTKYHDGKS